MIEITLRFLGEVTILANDVPITGFRSDKTRALLAYLAIEPHTHTRKSIAGLLWPEVNSDSSLTNLRNTLYRLRLTLDGAAPGAADALLTVTRQGIGLDLTATTVDVLEFEKLVEATPLPSESDAASLSAHLERLSKITSLYGGELMAGFGIDDAPDFEEWLLIRREVLQQRAIMAFSALASGYEAIGETQRAHTVATQLLELDTYREETYRQVMRCLAKMGQPELALNQFLQMRRRFQDEMGVSPADETLDLVQEIKDGGFTASPLWPPDAPGVADVVEAPRSPSEPPRADAPMPPRRLAIADVPDPGHVYGRLGESDQLTAWVQEGCRVVAVTGLGGVGKTSLVAHWVRELASNDELSKQFDHILWYSLVNAPPLTELLTPLLQVLSDQTLVNLPGSVEERLRLLLQYLHERRVVLILDNFESILDAHHTSAYRQGYEDYGQLIEQLLTRQHQSILIFTSRERPAGTTRHAQHERAMRRLQLDGLDIAATRELLSAQGLRAQAGEDALLMARYSGNPLALKLVADTVSEVFGGAIGEFLGEDSIVFDDVRSILDQQFERLSLLGQSILFSLAIAREPLSSASLRAELLSLPNHSDFVGALRRLQRHALVMRQADGFSLQNVVIEYLTDRLIRTVFDEIVGASPALLHRHPLLKAASKEYVRQSQARLILAPLGDQLFVHFGRSGLAKHLWQLLAHLRTAFNDRPSYAGGNVLNLLLHLGLDVNGANFAGLNIRQGDLRQATLFDVDFRGVDFAQTTFASSFGAIQCIALAPEFTPEIMPEAPSGAPQASPDDEPPATNILAAGTAEGDIWLWQLERTEVLGVLESHAGIAFSVKFAPGLIDGQRLLASAHADGSIAIWDVSTRTCLKTLLGHTRPVLDLAFCCHREILASSSEDHTIRIWNIRSGELLLCIEHHTEWVTSLACHPYENLLASGDRDGNICLWHFDGFDTLHAASSTTIAPIATLQQHNHAVFSLDFSPDGTHLASAGMDRTICLWEMTDRQLLHQLDGHATIRAVTFSPDSRRLATASADGNVRIWDVRLGQPLDTLRGHTSAVRAVAITSRGDVLVTGGLDDAIRVWSLHDSSQAQPAYHVQGHRDEIHTVLIAPGGDSFYIGTKSGIVASWGMGETPAHRRPHQITMHQREVRALALHPTQSLLASISFDRLIHVCDPRNPLHVQTLHAHTDDAYCVEFTRDGKLLVSAGSDGRILLWQADSNGNFSLYKTMQSHEWQVKAMACSPTHPLVVTGDLDSTLRVWNLVTGKRLVVADDEAYLSSCLAFHPSGTLMASGELSGRIQLLELCDLDLERNHLRFVKRHTLVGHRAGVNHLRFSADGRYVAGAAADHIACVWDVATGELLHMLRGHSSAVRTTDFGADGATLLSGASDGTIKLWDLSTGACLQTLTFPGPYDGMNIHHATGLSAAQRQSLKSLGAIEAP